MAATSGSNTPASLLRIGGEQGRTRRQRPHLHRRLGSAQPRGTAARARGHPRGGRPPTCRPWTAGRRSRSSRWPGTDGRTSAGGRSRGWGGASACLAATGSGRVWRTLPARRLPAAWLPSWGARLAGLPHLHDLLPRGPRLDAQNHFCLLQRQLLAARRPRRVGALRRHPRLGAVCRQQSRRRRGIAMGTGGRHLMRWEHCAFWWAAAAAAAAAAPCFPCTSPLAANTPPDACHSLMIACR